MQEFMPGLNTPDRINP